MPPLTEQGLPLNDMPCVWQHIFAVLIPIAVLEVELLLLCRETAYVYNQCVIACHDPLLYNCREVRAARYMK